MRYFLLAAAASLFVVSSGIGANLAVNPGFETMETTSGGWPGSYGHWNGDYSAIVGETGGITPYEGNSMLQFKGTSFNGAGSSTECVLFQLIDLSSQQTLISSGNALVNFSAYFNRENLDSNTDNHFSLVILAFEGQADTFASRWENQHHTATLDYISTPFIIDADVNTWEKGFTSLALPVNTDFIAIAMAASENVYNDNSYPEFDGHFADAVSVEIVPEPATIGLLSIGVLMLKKKKLS